jgi:hypothetical protein
MERKTVAVVVCKEGLTSVYARTISWTAVLYSIYRGAGFEVDPWLVSFKDAKHLHSRSAK